MEDHGSHTGIKFEVCFFLGHSWLVKINDVKFFLLDEKLFVEQRDKNDFIEQKI